MKLRRTKMKGFTKFETELLLSEVLKAKEENKSLSIVFEEVAKKTSRAKGSVRNYYYTLIKDDDKKRELEKTVSGALGLKATKARSFSKEDENFLFSAICEGKKKGKSIRRIVTEISNGDEKLALRYQNKYRSYLSKVEKERLQNIPIQPEDFKYFDKLSREIDGLVERIKDKYASECLKLKKENEELVRELKFLKRQGYGISKPYFTLNDR